MFCYNEVLVGKEWDHIDSHISSKNDNDNGILRLDIRSCREETCGYNLLDDIIQHPFIEDIENIDLNIVSNDHYREKICLIPYRITNHDDHHFVEFNVGSDFHVLKQSILDKDKDKGKDKVYETLNNTLHHISGRKKMMGSVTFKNKHFILVQVRNSNMNFYNNNWVTIWDLVVNRHVFGDSFNEEVVEFFTHHSTLSDLILQKKISSKPVALYCNIHTNYLQYVLTYQTAQYCQNDDSPLFNLTEYQHDTNVRVLCFIEDTVSNNNKQTLVGKDYIQTNVDKTVSWIFKNEKRIVSFTAK
jgi:hypothetical protein